MQFHDRMGAVAIAFALTLAENVRAATSSTDVGSIILQGLNPFETNNTTSSTPTPTPSVPASITDSLTSTFVSAASLRPTDGFSWSKNDGVTDLPQAQQCFSDVVSWRAKSIAWFNANVGNRTWPQTITTTTTTELWETSTTIYPTNASIYTLCDHSPRADVKPITEHSSWNTTLSFTYTRAAVPTYSVPQPCIPNNHMCRLWYYESDLPDSADDELISNCGLPAHMDPVNKPCLIGGGPVRLIYTPVTTEGGNLCAHNGTTVLPAANATMAPITALGTTFDPASVYVSFSTLYAYYDGFGTNETIGPTFTNHIVALTSAAISTHCGGWFAASGPGTSLNYADLNWPVAASAYECQARCNLPEQSTWCDLQGCHLETLPHDPGCKTIWSDVDPILALPTDVSKMVPAWSTCSAWDETLPNFWFDPPVALQPALTVAGPGVVGGGDFEPTTTPARPAQTPTALPEITAGPTTWGSVPAGSGQGQGTGSGTDSGDGHDDGNGNGNGEGDHSTHQDEAATTDGQSAGVLHPTGASTGAGDGGALESPAGVSMGPQGGSSEFLSQAVQTGGNANPQTSSNGGTTIQQASTTQVLAGSSNAQDGTLPASQQSNAASAPSSTVFTGSAPRLGTRGIPRWSCLAILFFAFLHI